MIVTISRWGNSFGIRIPKSALEESRLGEGDEVEIIAERETLVVRKAKRRSLAELVDGITADNRHNEAFVEPFGAERW